MTSEEAHHEAQREHRMNANKPRLVGLNHIALDTPSTRAMVATGKQAWFALMNRKSRTGASRSPVQTRPRLLTGCPARRGAACSLAAAEPVRSARSHSEQAAPLPADSLVGQPPRSNCESTARSARTLGQDHQDRDLHEQDRPSDGETQANTAGVSWASGTPLAKASGCPPNRVDPNPTTPRGVDVRPAAPDGRGDRGVL